MWWKLEEEILKAANKRVRAYAQYRRRIPDENARRNRRTIKSPELLSVRTPRLWDMDAGFNPFHVRARAESIAHSMTKALRSGRYVPHQPAGIRVPKHDGGDRLVSSFEIADEVISSRLYRSLLHKNRPRLSARSYAYRDDLDVYDAIMHIQSEWNDERRVFVAEYDFSNFFQSISHDYLWRTWDEVGIISTALEKQLVERFLTSAEPYFQVSEKGQKVPSRTKGVLQGTSISLFLANLAATPLDRALERLAVNFVRYADDTLIWSRDYGALCQAVEELHQVSDRIGAQINQDKSNGVRLLILNESRVAEMPSTYEVEYLSHSIGLRSIRIKDSAMKAMQTRILKIIFDNLLREPTAGTQDISRVFFHDRDYASCIWQLRRFLYGRLTENEVRRFEQRSIPLKAFTGAVARYPLVDDRNSLYDFDQWLNTQLWLALRKRSKLLRPFFYGSLPIPWEASREDLRRLMLISISTGKPVDMRIPSASRMAQVVRKAVSTHGTAVVGRGVGLYNVD